MRLRILELPKQQDGEQITTPYLIVVDQCGPEGLESWNATASSFAVSVGAVGMIVFTDGIELPAALHHTDPAARPIIEAAARELGIEVGG